MVQYHETPFAIQINPRIHAVAGVIVEAVVPVVAGVQAVALLL